MLFSISDLEADSVWIDEQVVVPAFSWTGGDQVRCESVTLAGELKRSHRGVEFVGRYSTVAHLHCVRCLADVATPLEGKFHLHLVSEADFEVENEEQGGESETPADSIDLFPIKEEKIDLAELLREQLDLALPIRVLCGEKCRGLCPACGRNLNTDPCSCLAAEDEPGGGLAQLRGIMERRKGNNPSGRK